MSRVLGKGINTIFTLGQVVAAAFNVFIVIIFILASELISMKLFSFLLLFLLSPPLLAYASTDSTTQPRPGTLIIITFENGTSKVLRSSSTNVLPVTGGYFIVDPSVIPSQPLPAKTVSQNIANQFYTAISIVYQIIIGIDKGPPVEPVLLFLLLLLMNAMKEKYYKTVNVSQNQ